MFFAPQRFCGMDTGRTASRHIRGEQRDRQDRRRDQQERREIGSAVAAGTAGK